MCHSLLDKPVEFVNDLISRGNKKKSTQMKERESERKKEKRIASRFGGRHSEQEFNGSLLSMELTEC